MPAIQSLAALNTGTLNLPKKKPFPQYKFLAVDIMSMQVLDELPLTSFAASLKLNAAGDFKASMQMAGFTPPRRRALVEATEPGRTAVYAERNGNLLGGWVIYKRDRGKDPIDLVGAGLLALLDPLIINGFGSVDGGLHYAGVDQMAIVRDLVGRQMALDAGNLPIELDSTFSGVLRTVDYDGTKLLSVGDEIANLSELDQGFDYDIVPEYTTDGNIRNVLRLGYPRRGRANVLDLDYPGDGVDSLDWPEDATKAATHVYAAGEGEGGSRVIASAANTNLIAANYPRRVLVDTASTESELVNVQARANATARTARAPVVTPKITVLADTNPPIGSYIPGDDITMRLNTPGFPETADGGAGLVKTLRIIEIEFRPPQTGREYVDITAADVTV